MVRSVRLRSMIRSMSWKYSSRIGPESLQHRLRALLAFGSDEFIDARAEIVQHEVLLGRSLALVDLLRPLLERQLDAEGLVDGEGDIEKVQAVDAEIVDGVALRFDGVTRDIARLGNDIGHGL